MNNKHTMKKTVQGVAFFAVVALLLTSCYTTKTVFKQIDDPSGEVEISKSKVAFSLKQVTCLDCEGDDTFKESTSLYDSIVGNRRSFSNQDLRITGGGRSNYLDVTIYNATRMPVFIDMLKNTCIFVDYFGYSSQVLSSDVRSEDTYSNYIAIAGDSKCHHLFLSKNYLDRDFPIIFPTDTFSTEEEFYDKIGDREVRLILSSRILTRKPTSTNWFSHQNLSRDPSKSLWKRSKE